MRRCTNPYLKHYVYFVPMSDPDHPDFEGFWSMTDHDWFRRRTSKEIATGEITRVRLRFQPIRKGAYTGWDSDRRRFVCRGRSPGTNYFEKKYMFGNNVRMRDDKTVGKRRKITHMRPYNPRRL